MNTYDVDVHHEDGYWVGVVRGLRGGATETRRLAALADEVRDLVSGLTDLDPGLIDLRMHRDQALHGHLAKQLNEYADARENFDLCRTYLATTATRTAAELHAAGISLRDSAELMGVSFQRVQQLLAEHRDLAHEGLLT